tara:strand:- start:6231 stop:6695 length:465 start_codon:yes stop_codon:yes gene_type:complete
MNIEEFKLSKNLTLKEMKVSKDHPDVAANILFNEFDIVSLQLWATTCFQPIRDKFGPTQVLSGKRSNQLNKAIGGSQDSDHLYCLAGDIHCVKIKDQIDVFHWIIEESNIYYRQVIYYPEQGFIHISCNRFGRPYKKEALIKTTNGYIKYKGDK